MIELKNVFVCHGKKEIINNLSFTALSGSITVILGKNGSGKTTLLGSLAGIIPYGGSICIDGDEIASVSVRERAKRVASMPQLLKPIDITVSELVSYGRQPYTGITGVLSEADNKVVSDVIAELDLGSIANKTANRISGGELQKAYFAMLLAQDTPNMLLDEPGAFLDSEYMNRLCGFLACAKEKGKTVIAVLHDINRALEIADKLVVLKRDGYFVGSASEFADSDIPEKHFSLRRFECVSNGERMTFFR